MSATITSRFQRRNSRVVAALEAQQFVEDPYADVRSQIHHDVIEQLGPRLATTGDSKEEASIERDISDAITSFLDRVERPLSKLERSKIHQDVRDDVLGYGPIDCHVRDESVTEIMVNGSDSVYVERSGRIERTSTRFVDNAHVERIIGRIVSEVGRRIDESSPMVDARLPDGSRVNAIIAPLSLVGPVLTIRKFRSDPLTMPDLVSLGTVTPQAAMFLELCVQGAANILVSGGTGSGKTTFLNVLSAAIPESERIVTIEDAAELQLKQQHVVTLESRPSNIEGSGEVTIRDLVRNTLRMRPDRIIVGECRGPEAVDMLQAMNTGHEGSMTTIHANGARDAMSRVETLVLTSGVELPQRAIREQIASSLHLVVHTARLVDGSRRVTRISEVTGMEEGVVTMQDIFMAEESDAASLLGELRATGITPTFAGHLTGNGVELPPSLFDTDSSAVSTNTHRTRFQRTGVEQLVSSNDAVAATRPTHRHSTITTPTSMEETMTHAHLREMLRGEEGQTMAEYGVVLAVITIGIVATLGLLSDAINGALSSVIAKI